jgi:glycosyltransferase involved in cell wall biosynthesis
MHVTSPAVFGGLERVVLALAAGHQRRGHQVSVTTVLGRGASAAHPLVAALRAAAVPVDTIEVSTRAYLEERRRVAALLRERRCDILHTHGYRCDVVDGAAGRRVGIATVATVHGFTGGGWKNRLFEYLDRRALRRIDAVVAVSRAQMAQLRGAGVPDHSLVHIANAWSPDGRTMARDAARAALGLPGDAVVIAFVGRLSSEKGADLFLAALARLRERPWLAVVIGDGQDRQALEAQATAAGVGDRIRWLGIVRDAGRLFAALDVFVLSSRTEGIPIVLFEAMAAGLPIVATRVGGVPEVVSEREALLVPSEDPRALAGAIAQALDDPAAATRRAQAASEVLASRFALDPWLAAYEELYRRTVARRRTA